MFFLYQSLGASKIPWQWFGNTEVRTVFLNIKIQKQFILINLENVFFFLAYSIILNHSLEICYKYCHMDNYLVSLIKVRASSFLDHHEKKKNL